MAIYHIKKPEYTGWQWFKSIISRVIFPPILLWDLLKLGANKLLGEAVGSLVLPAQDIDEFYVTNPRRYEELKDNFILEEHKVITYDNASLDTVEIQPKLSTNIEPRYQKYIINFVGNAMAYQNIMTDMLEDAQALSCNVIGFNLRGVSLSTGRATSTDDLVTDGIAQVQRLLDQGISPQNITLKGHSLGAGIASLVAYHFHQQDKPINIFNGRSFSSITNFIVGHIRITENDSGQRAGHKETFGGKLLGWLAKPFIKFGVSLVKWEIDAEDAFKAIPEAYREYISVRTSKKNRTDMHLDDPVIPHYASIHEALKEDRNSKKSEIKHLISLENTIISRADPLTKKDLLTANKSLQAAEKQFKNRKMENQSFYCPNGHIVSMGDLQNCSGKTASTFFQEFVQRAQSNHGVSVPPNLQL